jgi:hypothetical protein
MAKSVFGLLCFSAILILQSSPGLSDQKMGDITVPGTIEFQGEKLILNGTAFRTAGFLNTKVYLGALYLKAKSGVAEEIINSTDTRIIEVWPKYDIVAADSAKGWDKSLKDNCDVSCAELKDEINKFLSSIGDFKTGDHHRYVFSKSGLFFLNNGKEVFKSSNLAFSKLIITTWLGKVPPTEKLKNAMLGK